ncbi:MAG: hypothetical protein ACR2QM_01715 [Longimicrobiales bacterium]
MARCQGTTKSGAQCKRNTAEGEDYCSTHSPDNAAKTKNTAKTGNTAKTKSSGKNGGSKGAQSDRPKGKGSGSGTVSGDGLVSSGEDLLHLAIGVAITVAMFWLLKRGPR